jgi:hypothetical protein
VACEQVDKLTRKRKRRGDDDEKEAEIAALKKQIEELKEAVNVKDATINSLVGELFSVTSGNWLYTSSR